MPAAEKKFVLTHVFKDVLSMKENEYRYSVPQEHFGVPWRLSVYRNKEFLGTYIRCQHSSSSEWSIDTERVHKIVSVTGKIQSTAKTIRTFEMDKSCGGWNEFVGWEEMKKDYMIDGNLIVEAHVKILKMAGIEKKKLRNFDESMKEFSDVVLIVENEKFHVSKLTLAAQSRHFEDFFLQKFEESEKTEITLKHVDAKDFQNFLELLYGESPIDDDTVEGILMVAYFYDATPPIKKCEEFLIKESEKTLKEKLQLALKCELENLKNDCLSQINTFADIRSVLSYDSSEMDSSVVGALLQKSLSLFP